LEKVITRLAKINYGALTWPEQGIFEHYFIPAIYINIRHESGGAAGLERISGYGQK
jgi:hypothetical protein